MELGSTWYLVGQLDYTFDGISLCMIWYNFNVLIWTLTSQNECLVFKSASKLPLMLLENLWAYDVFGHVWGAFKCCVRIHTHICICVWSIHKLTLIVFCISVLLCLDILCTTFQPLDGSISQAVIPLEGISAASHLFGLIVESELRGICISDTNINLDLKFLLS